MYVQKHTNTHTYTHSHARTYTHNKPHIYRAENKTENLINIFTCNSRILIISFYFD